MVMARGRLLDAMPLAQQPSVKRALERSFRPGATPKRAQWRPFSRHVKRSQRGLRVALSTFLHC